MNIPKAIEILQHHIDEHHFDPSGDTTDSIKLAIDALKRIKNARDIGYSVPASKLPGEDPQ